MLPGIWPSCPSLLQHQRSSGLAPKMMKFQAWLCDSSHPRRDVVVKAVDKVHQFDSQQTHPVNLLIYGLFDLYILGQSSLQFLRDVCEIWKKHSSRIRKKTLKNDGGRLCVRIFTRASYFNTLRVTVTHTAESKCVQTVFGPFDLQQEEKHLIVDLLTLWADHNVDRPGNLQRVKQVKVNIKKASTKSKGNTFTLLRVTL